MWHGSSVEKITLSIKVIFSGLKIPETVEPK
jgi:hypothetical protein